MIPKQAIEKAIEGGWKPKDFEGFNYSARKQEVIFWKVLPREKALPHLIPQYERILGKPPHMKWSWQFERIALDPLFWQALGKALGWHDGYVEFAAMGFSNEWKLTAHRFYDLILTGGDTEAYWKEILDDWEGPIEQRHDIDQN